VDTTKQQYDIVARAVDFLANHQGSEAESVVALHLGLKGSQLANIFAEWGQTTPKEFTRLLDTHALNARLQQGAAMFRNGQHSKYGLADGQRDLPVSIEEIYPSHSENAFQGTDIHYGIYQSRFGQCILSSRRGKICKLDFLSMEIKEAIEHLESEFPGATLIQDNKANQSLFERVFSIRKVHEQKIEPLKLWLKGTPFQRKVWNALLQIPEGVLVSYETIAEMIGHPTAVRAVGTAIGKNPVAWLIPCHRVIRKNGKIGAYRWGKARKMAMIAYEALPPAE